jgi:hypothetical protein
MVHYGRTNKMIRVIQKLINTLRYTKRMYIAKSNSLVSKQIKGKKLSK